MRSCALDLSRGSSAFGVAVIDGVQIATALLARHAREHGPAVRCKAQCARSSAKRKSSRIRCCYYPERPLDRNCSGNPAWDRLRIIAIERNISLSHLWGNIENIMRLDPPWPGRRRVRSLSAAVRIFVMESTPFR